MNNGIKMAVDLLWVRPNQVGGIESYIRNLLDGLLNLNRKYKFWLLVSKDNAYSFEHYKNDERINIVVCPINSGNVPKRIVWQNFNLGKVIRKLGLELCFEPYYCKPFLGTKNIRFITTIHDLQANHYPEYFSKIKLLWMKLSWRNAVKTSSKIVAISEFVKQDIIDTYKISNNKVKMIYNPVFVNKKNILTGEALFKKYHIEDKKYYFTVSSLLPHKNIITLIAVINEIKRSKINLPSKLIVSGVGGKSRTQLEDYILKNNLSNEVLLTDFIGDAERNALYKHCKAFLFPSLFEGFGMPPIEAMMFGVPVVTTKCTCIPEVTLGQANYVDDPMSVSDWISKLQNCYSNSLKTDRYNINDTAEQYFEMFHEEYSLVCKQ